MASFSSLVKQQIIESLSSGSKALAALFGILIFAKDKKRDKLSFSTENETVAAFVHDALRLKCKVTNVSVCASDKKKCTYTVLVEGESDVKKVRAALSEYGNEFEIPNVPDKNTSHVLSGIFLASGSITDPNKEYHLEFVVPQTDMCKKLEELLTDGFFINAKHTMRKGFGVVYIKESENIEDLLTLMGASKSSLEIMNIKILKNVRNKVNRVMNCENANIERTVSASEKQIEDIELIEKTIGLESLSEELYETAVVRYENPELTLKELGEMLTPKISKSGVNHRLEKIKAAADNIRNNGGKSS